MSGYSQAEKRGRDDITRFARSARWRVQCVSYAEAEASRYSFVKNFGTRDIGGLLDFWKPDGCIVECGAAPRCLQPADFAGVPVVFLDRDPTTLNEPATCICSDNRKIAAVAFEEFIRVSSSCGESATNRAQTTQPRLVHGRGRFLADSTSPK